MKTNKVLLMLLLCVAVVATSCKKEKFDIGGDPLITDTLNTEMVKLRMQQDGCTHDGVTDSTGNNFIDLDDAFTTFVSSNGLYHLVITDKGNAITVSFNNSVSTFVNHGEQYFSFTRGSDGNGYSSGTFEGELYDASNPKSKVYLQGEYRQVKTTRR